MSLSPWDLTANLIFDFSLYRPRRPSYVIATQSARQRNESYRHATKPPGNQNDFIDGIVKKKRKASYKAATESEEVSEFEEPKVNGDTHNPNFTKLRQETRVPSDCTSIKNLVVLSLSFLLVFTAFRSIQNLQSSLNASGRLGFISLSCLHLAMFLTSLFGPILVDRLTSKWSIVLGFFSYLIWIAANFWPHFFTLVPSSICVGFGQSLVWSAQVTYMRSMIDKSNNQKKSADSSFRFNGIFLASFQTSHVWGNLLASVLLSQSSVYGFLQQETTEGSSLAFCGIYDSCEERPNVNTSSPVTLVPEPVLTLMSVYMGSASLGLLLSVLLLSRLNPPGVDAVDVALPCGTHLRKNLKLMTVRKKFSYLIPLLIFNGFEQAFVCADYTKSYVSCSVGVAYVGYTMMTMGVTNFIFSFILGFIIKCVPREVLIGTASILHMALMVVLLVWIPDSSLLPVFFVISAFWGVCNAIWQTQCNCLVSLCCEQGEQEVAFQNVRLLQGLGASLTFTLGIFVCASVKLYVMIGLLTTAVLFYVVLEYNVRRDDILPTMDHPAPIEVVDRK